MATAQAGSLPGELDLIGRRGDRWGPFRGTPREGIDLSGRTWLAQIRTSQDRPESVIATIEVDDSETADGVLVLTVLPAETSKLATGPDAGSLPDGTPFEPGRATYFWDVQGVNDEDPEDVKTYFGGKVLVHGDVSVVSA